MCGFKTLRVLIGHDEIILQINQIIQLIQTAIVIYCLLITFLIMLNKFMYICIWKSMRQMDDNLIVGISNAWATFMR